jgi:hypothetical protein
LRRSVGCYGPPTVTREVVGVFVRFRAPLRAKTQVLRNDDALECNLVI